MTTEETVEDHDEPQIKPLKFRDFSDFEAAVNYLVLPINGKEYRIPEVGIRTATLLLGISSKKKESPTEWEEDSEAYYRTLLGSAYDQMVADDVPASAVPRAAFTVWIDVVHGRAAAVSQWEMSNNPEAWAAMTAAPESPAPQKSATKRAAKASGTSTAKRSTTSTSRGARTRTSTAARPARRGRTSSSAGSNSKVTSSPS